MRRRTRYRRDRSRLAPGRLDRRFAMTGAPSNLDTIELRGIRAFGRHGADAGEKDVPQPQLFFAFGLSNSKPE